MMAAFLELLNTPRDCNMWVHHILPFLGPGHFIYIAGVSKPFKELYLAYFHTIKPPPKLRHERSRAIPTATFHSAAFSSVSCAEYWDTISNVEDGRLEDRLVCAEISKHGNLQVLKWARKKKVPWKEWTLSRSAVFRPLAFGRKFTWDERTCYKAARNGHLEILKYAHNKGCPWSEWTCAYAAINGHLEILKYAHEKGCPWNRCTCECAAANGHLDVLKYAHKKGCEWDELTCAFAAKHGQWEILKYAHEKGCAWDGRTRVWAAQHGFNEIAQWALDNGCP